MSWQIAFDFHPKHPYCFILSGIIFMSSLTWGFKTFLTESICKCLFVFFSLICVRSPNLLGKTNLLKLCCFESHATRYTSLDESSKFMGTKGRCWVWDSAGLCITINTRKLGIVRSSPWGLTRRSGTQELKHNRRGGLLYVCTVPLQNPQICLEKEITRHGQKKQTVWLRNLKALTVITSTKKIDSPFKKSSFWICKEGMLQMLFTIWLNNWEAYLKQMGQLRQIRESRVVWWPAIKSPQYTSRSLCWHGIRKWKRRKNWK